MHVLIISGSSRPDSNVAAVVRHVSEVVEATAVTQRVVDLSALRLPVFVHGEDAQAQNPGIDQIRSDADWADGFIIVTPEYHGNMGGALKNWFDFLYAELAGKLAGVIAVTGGGNGDMSVTAVRNCFSWCHGFTLPFFAGCSARDFERGELVSDRARDRISRIAHDVVRYGQPLRATFESARALGSGVESGFAGLHT